MKSFVAALLLITAGGLAHAQVPAGAPAGTTGTCKDGTYSSAASKRGACAGHKGVKDWYQADATPVAPAASITKAGTTSPSAAVVPASPAPVPAAPVAATPAKASPTATPTTPMAGGGNGQVWVNTASKVYHCEGSRYYGKTKAGQYMSESAATAAGNRPDHGKACKA